MVNSRTLSAYASLLMPFFFIGGLALSIAHNPWFSFTDNALSDMGSVRNPVNYYFNWFVIILALIGFIASLGAFRSGLSYLMPFAMISLFFVGVFPEEYPPHAPAAVLFYVLALADIALVGIKLGRRSPRNYLWAVASFLVFLAMVWMIKGEVFEGLAIPELVGATFILAWFVYLGVLQLRR